MNINEEIDEILYPNIKLLKKFDIAKEYYNFKLVDYRNEYWYFNDKSIICSPCMSENGKLIGKIKLLFEMKSDEYEGIILFILKDVPWRRNEIFIMSSEKHIKELDNE